MSTLQREAHEAANGVISTDCPVYRALGHSEVCPGSSCVFHRVPGIEGCAIAQWAPEVDEHPGLAGWFLTRRLEAEEAAAAREARFGPTPPR